MSVLQGYIRLLQRQRDAGHPETAMLEAMLDATGRLTAIARQASELGAWLAARPTAPLEPVAAVELFDELAGRVRTDDVTVVRPTEPVTIRADVPALAGAVLALVESMARETGGSPIEVRQAAPGNGSAISLVARKNPSSGAEPATVAARALAFDRGGAGLALVAASYVLEAHGAEAGPGSEPGSINISFRDQGGPS